MGDGSMSDSPVTHDSLTHNNYYQTAPLTGAIQICLLLLLLLLLLLRLPFSCSLLASLFSPPFHCLSLTIIIIIFLPLVDMFPREFKN